MFFAEHFPLDRYNTFGVAARARFFAQVASEAELVALLTTVTARRWPVLPLGGGSNLVLAEQVPALVLQPRLRCITVMAEQGDSVWVRAGAGEPWHGFVRHCLNRGWNGLENLSLIPGTVGAAPIQNIGAYGVELVDVFDHLEAIDIATGRLHRFDRAACRFAYRDSLFKQEAAGRYVITAVVFRLHRARIINTSYGDIARELELMGCARPTPQAVSNAVIRIRTRKLPDPARIGNAGSFFKNPVVSVAQAEALRAQSPSLVAYPQAGGVKLAAGWLIDQAGWKGRREGAVGCYDKQALVLVNYGGASGADILGFAAQIQQSVLARFGVELEMEPRCYG